MCVCVFGVFFSHPFWTSSSLDVPAGVTQEEGHTGFSIRLLSTVRAFIFLARRIQPFLSLVDREVIFFFFFFREKNPVYLPGSNSHHPKVSEGCEVTSSELLGRPDVRLSFPTPTIYWYEVGISI